MWPATGRGTDRTKSTQMSNPFRVFLPPVADDDVDGVKLFIRSLEKKKKWGKKHFHFPLLNPNCQQTLCTFIQIMTQVRKLFAK